MQHFYINLNGNLNWENKINKNIWYMTMYNLLRANEKIKEY